VRGTVSNDAPAASDGLWTGRKTRARPGVQSHVPGGIGIVHVARRRGIISIGEGASRCAPDDLFGLGQPSTGASSGDHVGSTVVAGSWKDLICWDWAVGI